MYSSFIYKYHIQHLFSAFPPKKCLEIIRSSSQDGHGRPKKKKRLGEARKTRALNDPRKIIYDHDSSGWWFSHPSEKYTTSSIGMIRNSQYEWGK